MSYDEGVKRRLFLILLLLLLLGAIVNVAVAWGCGFFNDLHTDWPNVERTTIQTWAPYLCVERRFGSEEVRCCPRLSDAVDPQSLAQHCENPWWVKWHHRFGAVGTGPWGAAHGWPMYSLSAWRDWNPDPERTALDAEYLTFGGWDLPMRRNSSSVRLIPLTPIQPGFAINTLFYAVVLWVLVAGPRALNRKRRRMRGLCVNCAYDLRGNSSGVCPECDPSFVDRQRADHAPAWAGAAPGFHVMLQPMFGCWWAATTRLRGAADGVGAGHSRPRQRPI